MTRITAVALSILLIGSVAVVAPVAGVSGESTGPGTAGSSLAGTDAAPDRATTPERANGSFLAAASESVPLFAVTLEPNGSADVRLQLMFNLSSDSDRRAFETLREDEAAREDVMARFLSRMRSVANSSERRVERDMRVYDAAISLSTIADGGTGVVTLSVTWDNMAGITRADQPHLIVTEPFASGFIPSREFRVRIIAPDIYRLTSVTPVPASQENTSATWSAGTDLTGFTLVFSPETETPLPQETIDRFDPSSPTVTTAIGDDGPGQTGLVVGAVLVAVAAGGYLLWRRRRKAESESADGPGTDGE